MDWSQVQPAAVALSAIVATATFLISVIANWKIRRNDEVRGWQEAVIQGIFQRGKTEELTFGDIQTAYRSEAAVYREIKLTDAELSDGKLRQILVSLIDKRVIEQVTFDRYILAIHVQRLIPKMSDFLDLSSALKSQMTRSSEHSEIADKVVAFIYDNNFKYTLPDVVVRLSTDLQLDVAKLRSVILRLASSESVIIREDTFVGVGTGVSKVKPSYE